MSLKLYLASANPGKLREFCAAAKVRGIALEAVPGIENLPPCHEDGATFAENARKKALHYSVFVEDPVFADDSGICVEALGGAPGVHSARFAGPRADDEANNQKLLTELRRLGAVAAAYDRHPTTVIPARVTPPNRRGEAPGLAPVSRAAHYICIIALAERGRILTMVEGRADGLILDTPRGAGGFGYDPLFFYPPLARTFADLTPEEKFAVSHRGEAFRRLLNYLTRREQAPSCADGDSPA